VTTEIRGSRGRRELTGPLALTDEMEHLEQLGSLEPKDPRALKDLWAAWGHQVSPAVLDSPEPMDLKDKKES